MVTASTSSFCRICSFFVRLVGTGSPLPQLSVPTMNMSVSFQ
jgi:hypothetical protein